MTDARTCKQCGAVIPPSIPDDYPYCKRRCRMLAEGRVQPTN